MQRLKTITLFLLMAGLFTACINAARPDAGLKRRSLPEWEQRLDDIDAELEQLAGFTLRGGTGALRYRSRNYKSPDHEEWIRIDLDKEVSIDQVVLVPVLWRDSKTGFRSEGFPRAFRIIAGTSQSTNVVASFSAEDKLLPRIAPLAVPFPAVEASWVRIEASTLSPDILKKQYNLQFSEIMVFNGQENVALRKKVKAPRSRADRIRSNNRQNLTDGFVPYLMDAAQGALSKSDMIRVKKTEPPPSLMIDLQAAYPVNQINLHAAGVALSVPMINLESHGVPRHVRITGSNQPDYADETVLCEYRQDSIYDSGPIMMRRFPTTQCRYIRIVILDHQPVISLREKSSLIAFSEIEVISDSQNVALGAPVTISDGLAAPPQTFAKITDGLNYYGHILPLREWMNQLARRHDLERERPRVVEELNHRYARQKTCLRIATWVVAFLLAGTVIIILIGQVVRQRAIFETRERIAANLHDELGANLHAIGLFGDLAKQEIRGTEEDEKWSKLVQYIEEVRTLTARAGKTARYCTHMLEAKEFYENLAEEMKRTAGRLLTDLEHDLAITNTELLEELRPRRRIGLFLFYQECLTNIIRHSGATRVNTRLTTDNNGIYLTVSDNGVGVKELPHSLKRRARLLKGKLALKNPAGGGTCIMLKLKPRKFGTQPRSR